MKKKILIVVSDYYQNISSNLEKAAIKVLKKNSFSYKIIKAPGVFEIPVIIAKNSKKYIGFVAIGCVIKGKTPHFNYISKSTINALMDYSIKYKKPIGNGLITCLNITQAKIRSSKNGKNRGKEAANAVVRVLKNA